MLHLIEKNTNMVYSNYRVPATATVTEVKFGATPIKISQMIKNKQ